MAQIAAWGKTLELRLYTDESVYTLCWLHVACTTLSHVNNKIPSKAFEMILDFCGPPDRWHWLHRQVGNLLSAPRFVIGNQRLPNAHQPECMLPLGGWSKRLREDVSGLLISTHINEVELFLLLSLRGINLLRKERMAPHESGWIMTTEPYATLLEWWFMYDLFRFVNDHFLFGFMLGFIQEMGFALTAVWVWCSTW